VISVQANYPGASPDTVANNIATPLERPIHADQWTGARDFAEHEGHVSFTLQFALEKSIDAAATDVQTAISQATGSLPVDLPSPPTYSKTNPNDQPIMYISAHQRLGHCGPALRLRKHPGRPEDQHPAGRQQRECIRHQSAVRIKVDPSAMWARGISIDDLVAAVKNGTSYTGGQFDGAAGTALLRPNGQLESAQAYGNLIVSSNNGAPVYLHDIAQAQDSVQMSGEHAFLARGYGVPHSYGRCGGKPSSWRECRGSSQEHKKPATPDRRRASGVGAHHAHL